MTSFDRIPSKMISFLLALVFLCALFSPAAAETSTVADDVSQSGAGYAAVLYDSTSGLTTSEANCVVQSSDGFIWIGGYSGLVRYDGNRFLRYDSSYGVTSVMCLFVDSRDRLWIGTNDNGLAVMKDNEITFFSGEALSSSFIRVIAEDKAGNIVVGTTDGVAYVDPDGAIRCVEDEEIKNEYIYDLVVGEDGVIYGDTLGGSFFALKDFRLYKFIDGETLDFGTVNAVCPDPENPGFAWLGTQNGEVRYGTMENGFEDTEAFSVAPHRSVNCLRLIEGRLWVCADNGVGLFDSGRYIALENLPMTNSVDSIMMDHEGNLWFTSSRQGVMKIAHNRFTDLSLMARLDPMVVNSTCLLDGNLYLGTDEGLVILDREYNRIENELTKTVGVSRVRCVMADSHGVLWVSTYGDAGLIRFDSASGEITAFTKDDGLASNRTRSTIELADGSLAVATNSGVNIIKDKKVVDTFDGEDGLNNLQILCLEQTASGELLCGSDGDGIYIIDGDNTKRVGKEDGLSSEVILRMRRDPKDDSLCWIVTSNSVAYMRSGKVTTVKDFPYTNNFDMYFDGIGRIWVLSSNGIYVVTRDSMLGDDGLEYTFYDTECGVPHIATANSFSCLDGGTLYIACSTGVTTVDIDDDSDVGSELRLAVPYLTVDDEYLAVEGESVTVASDCKRLTIHPFAFTYSLNNPRISYRLEGFDDVPFEVDRRDLDQVVYTNLDGGSYTFVLSVINPMTGEPTQTLRLTINKERTLFEQWWFWAILALALIVAAAAVLWIIGRRKTAAMLAKQEEQRKYINGITKVISQCVDMKDAYTNGHSERVAKYTAMLARRLGKSEEEVEKIYNIALLHDIGKISIPDSILNKPGRLTDEEFAIMKSHSERGYEILKDITIEPELAIGAGYHHERLDGRGYPRGIKGDEIPEIAQIIAVADTFDAMYSTRPYRKKMELSEVAEEIKRSAGTQLSADVVKVFCELVDEGAFDDE